MKFIWVPGGCYEMGYGGWKNSCDGKKIPYHDVCVDGFWIGKTEVTQEQWKKIMGNNPSGFKKCGKNCPVENVSWYDAQEFAMKLSRENGGKYEFRLPLEAEWEYACRSGGRTERYAGGEDLMKVAWFKQNSKKKTHRVGTKARNGLGLYDMSGNVWEWCEDFYDKDSCSAELRNTPRFKGEGLNVMRGGSWDSQVRDNCCGHLYSLTSYRKDNNLGFRLVRKK